MLVVGMPEVLCIYYFLLYSIFWTCILSMRVQEARKRFYGVGVSCKTIHRGNKLLVLSTKNDLIQSYDCGICALILCLYSAHF
jgi:hypothetical protein